MIGGDLRALVGSHVWWRGARWVVLYVDEAGRVAAGMATSDGGVGAVHRGIDPATFGSEAVPEVARCRAIRPETGRACLLDAGHRGGHADWARAVDLYKNCSDIRTVRWGEPPPGQRLDGGLRWSPAVGPERDAYVGTAEDSAPAGGTAWINLGGVGPAKTDRVWQEMCGAVAPIVRQRFGWSARCAHARGHDGPHGNLDLGAWCGAVDTLTGLACEGAGTHGPWHWARGVDAGGAVRRWPNAASSVCAALPPEPWGVACELGAGHPGRHRAGARAWHPSACAAAHPTLRAERPARPGEVFNLGISGVGRESTVSEKLRCERAKGHGTRHRARVEGGHAEWAVDRKAMERHHPPRFVCGAAHPGPGPGWVAWCGRTPRHGGPHQSGLVWSDLPGGVLEWGACGDPHGDLRCAQVPRHAGRHRSESGVLWSSP